MQRLMTPLKKGTKAYLTQEIVPALTEGLTRLGILRPEDPYMFMAEFLFKMSPNKDDYVFEKKEKVEALYQCNHSIPEVSSPVEREEIQAKDDEVAAGTGIQAVRALGTEKHASGLNDALSPIGGALNQAANDESESGLTEDTTLLDETQAQADAAVSRDKSQLEDQVAKCIDSKTEENVQVCDEETRSTARTSRSDANLSETESSPAQNAGEEPDEANTEKTDTSEPIPEPVPTDWDEETKQDLDEDTMVVKSCIQVDSKYVFAKSKLSQEDGLFAVDAWDVKTLERYHFECEGVNYEKLRGEAGNGTKLSRDIMAQLTFQEDSLSGAQILCVKDQ